MDDEKPFSHGKDRSGSFKKRSRNQTDNGKRKRHNPYPSHDHSSDPAKVIETLYRILCPVKKIGSVLGKGGEIVNALRDETRAKIRVADAIRGAEERVIIIFNYPSNQPERGNNDQDLDNEYDDMRPHCPAQDALLKVNDRIAADEYLRGGVVQEKTNPDDAVTARILVPSNQVGCLIGKGGTVIQKLRSEYPGASIRILSVDHLPPCAMETDELVQISGVPNAVKKALYDISTRLHEHPRKENPPIDELIYASTQGLFRSGASALPPPSQGNPMWSDQQPDVFPTHPPWFGGYRNEPSGYARGSYNSGRNGTDVETPEEFSMRILCPTGRIGGVIGKAGSTVRQLEQQTRARIQVEDTSPEAEERIIEVSSKEVPWDSISPTIDAVLQLQGRTSAFSEEGTVTTRLLVPSTKVGCLLGQGGNIITEMRRRTRADIRVYSKEDKPSYTSADEELVQISGNQDVAREALMEIASRLRTRTFRSGNAAVNPAPVFPDRGFAPLESMPSRRLPSSGMIGVAENAPPAYPGHAFAPRENLSNRGPPPSGMIGAANTGGYEYPKGPASTYESRGYPGSAYESQGYPGKYEGQGYTGRYEGQGYPGKYEGQGYPGKYEGQGYPGKYEGQGYPPGPSPAYTSYPNMSGTVEVKIPNSAVPSVLGAGGSNISDIRQISGARVKLQDPLSGASECVVEIHGSAEQMKAAQSLLQAFIASGGQNTHQEFVPPVQAPMHQPMHQAVHQPMHQPMPQTMHRPY